MALTFHLWYEEVQVSYYNYNVGNLSLISEINLISFIDRLYVYII